MGYKLSVEVAVDSCKMNAVVLLLVCVMAAMTQASPGCVHIGNRIIGYDLTFDKMGQASYVDECKAECDSRSECIGASMMPPDNRCYLHNGSEGSVYEFAGWKLYYKDCPSGLQGSCISFDHRMIGSDISFTGWGQAGSVDDCLAECDSRTECVGASLQPPDNKCYLHSTIDAASTYEFADWKLYYKDCQA